jgi:hypothetical protein
MEVNEKELKDRRILLSQEIERLQAQFQQAQIAMQSIPQMVASRQGEIAGIDKILGEAKVNKPSKVK